MCFLISITLNSTHAQVQRGKKDDAKAELISFKDRWGIKTNAVDWLLTVPNIGVEFDLGNTIRNKHTIGVNIKWNWNTSQKYTPSLIFNVFDARVEWRQYFRTRKRGGITKDANFKIGKEGKQGNAYGAGISVGYTAPLYGYRNNYIDLELGGSAGLLYTSYDVYTHDAESGCYPRIAEKCKGGHIVQLRDFARQALNEKINKMRERIDSINNAIRKQGFSRPDSLLGKEELEQWKLMQQERKELAAKEATDKLRKQVADSLGIQLSDTLTSEQEKTLRKALKVREEQLKRKAETQDSTKLGKRAAREAKQSAQEKKERKNKKDSGKKKKKDGKPEAAAVKEEKGDASGEAARKEDEG